MRGAAAVWRPSLAPKPVARPINRLAPNSRSIRAAIDAARIDQTLLIPNGKPCHHGLGAQPTEASGTIARIWPFRNYNGINASLNEVNTSKAPQTVRLTERDDQILRALSCCVRLFSVDQVGLAWWPGTKQPTSLAKKRLNELAKGGFVTAERAFARRLKFPHKAISSWSPGETTPNHASIAWKLQSRWTDAPRMVAVFTASELTSKRHIGKRANRLKRAFQLSHDLGTSDIFVAFYRKNPSVLYSWWSEDHYATERRGTKLPDAILNDTPTWPPKLVLEFGGAYSKRRVTAFHDALSREKIPYEIW